MEIIKRKIQLGYPYHYCSEFKVKANSNIRTKKQERIQILVILIGLGIITNFIILPNTNFFNTAEALVLPDESRLAKYCSITRSVFKTSSGYDWDPKPISPQLFALRVFLAFGGYKVAYFLGGMLMWSPSAAMGTGYCIGWLWSFIINKSRWY